MQACWKGYSSHGRLQKFFQGGNVNILLIIFRLLTLQCKWTFTKRFSVSTPQRKFPVKPRAPFASILTAFSSGAVGYTSLPQTCTFYHLLQLLLNWHINVVIKSLWTPHKWVWNRLELSTTTFAVLSLDLCWLNRTHFWNLLSELFSTLRLSKILFLFINCLISIFASTFYK